MTAETDRENRYRVSHICTLIRLGKATQDDMTFFNRHANPLLKRTIMKFILYRAAGMREEAHRIYYGVYPPSDPP